MERWIWIALVMTGCTLDVAIEGTPMETDPPLTPGASVYGVPTAHEDAPPCPGAWCMDPTNTHEVCVDLGADPENCGACAVSCPGTCELGVCLVCECPPGRFLLLNSIEAPGVYAEEVFLGCAHGRYTWTVDGHVLAWTGDGYGDGGLHLDAVLEECDTLEGWWASADGGEEVEGMRVP